MKFKIVDIETYGEDKDALNPFKGKVIACGLLSGEVAPTVPVGYHFSVGNVDVYCDDNEEMLVHQVIRSLSDDSVLVGYNIWRFDVPFLMAKALHYNFDVDVFLYRDSVDLWHLQKKYLARSCPAVSLHEFARFLGIEVDDEVSGADVPELYRKKKFDKIKKHCESDVNLTFKVFCRMYSIVVYDMRRRKDGDI